MENNNYYENITINCTCRNKININNREHIERCNNNSFLFFIIKMINNIKSNIDYNKKMKNYNKYIDERMILSYEQNDLTDIINELIKYHNILNKNNKDLKGKEISLILLNKYELEKKETDFLLIYKKDFNEFNLINTVERLKIKLNYYEAVLDYLMEIYSY